MASTYSEIPTHAKWLKDSSVRLSKRSKDTVLTKIDYFVNFYHCVPTDNLTEKKHCQNDIAGELYFLTDYWLKSFKSTPGMSKGREKAVQKLYSCVVHHLCKIFGGCAIATLPQKLEIFFGRKMTAHGEKIDTVGNNAKYLSRAQSEAYRLHFRKGRAYQWRNGKLVIADTTKNGDCFFGFANFVMSMQRDIYTKPQHVAESPPGKNENFYHSSYLNGDAVLCAGSIKIEKGFIKVINTDSGHYQPTDSHLINALRALEMHGIQTDDIEVQNFQLQGVSACAGMIFGANGSWAKLLERGQLNIQQRADVNATHASLEKTITTLWKKGLRQGLWKNDADGMAWFVGVNLQNWENNNGKAKFSGVDSNYVMTAIGKAHAANKKKMNRELLINWNRFLASTRDQSRSKHNFLKFAKSVKRKSSRFKRWPTRALAEHVRLLVQ